MYLLRRREIVVFITSLSGVLVLLNFLFIHPTLSDLAGQVNAWVAILVAFSGIMGTLLTLNMHVGRITKRAVKGWEMSIFTVLAFVVTAIIGLTIGTRTAAYEYISFRLLSPLMAAIYCIVVVYTLSAAYRGFLIRNLESAVMFAVVALIFLQNAPIGPYLWSGFNDIGNWIYDVPSLAAVRALQIVVAVGGLFMGIRILIGRERAQ